jgi:hypothetical protein
MVPRPPELIQRAACRTVVLRSPHLVLAHVGGDEGIALGHFPQFLHHRLRLDHQVGRGEFQAVAATPFVDLLPPVVQRRRVRLGIGRIELGQELDQHVLDVADDGNVHLDALGDRRWVDIDVDDLARVGGKVLRVADHAVVETGADGDQHVAVLHRHVGFIGPVHARHADEFVVAGAVGAQAHQGVGDGEAELIDQLVQFRRRMARITPPPV